MKSIFFSSNPTKKFPNWDSQMFNHPMINRTHFFKEGKAFIKSILDDVKNILNIPSDYKIILSPGSTTGAIACAYANFLMPGQKIQVPINGYFSKEWARDMENHFKLPVQQIKVVNDDADILLENIEFDSNADRFIVFADTTNGYKMTQPIEKTNGLNFVDIVCAAFVEDVAWDNIDVAMLSVQKVLGGDGSLGFLIMSPKALSRLDVEKPWPVPRSVDINLWKINELENGRTMATPSILGLIELAKILEWVHEVGGVNGLRSRTDNNFAAFDCFMEKNQQFEYLIAKEKNRSHLVPSIRLRKNRWTMEQVQAIEESMKAHAVYDIANFANPSFRFWLGPTQEVADVQEGMMRFEKHLNAL